MFRQLIAVLVVALCVGAAVTTAQTQSQGTADDIFIWHGELVSVEPGSGTFTVKAHILSEVAKDVARFNAGDRVVVTWSGVDRYAGAIRQIGKHEANRKITDPFAFPVELVSREAQNDYVTIRFRASASLAAAVKAVKPGEWVTVTARHRSSGDPQAIVSVAPYVKVTTS